MADSDRTFCQKATRGNWTFLSLSLYLCVCVCLLHKQNIAVFVEFLQVQTLNSFRFILPPEYVPSTVPGSADYDERQGTLRLQTEHSSAM